MERAVRPCRLEVRKGRVSNFGGDFGMPPGEQPRPPMRNFAVTPVRIYVGIKLKIPMRIGQVVLKVTMAWSSRTLLTLIAISGPGSAQRKPEVRPHLAARSEAAVELAAAGATGERKVSPADRAGAHHLAVGAEDETVRRRCGVEARPELPLRSKLESRLPSSSHWASATRGSGGPRSVPAVTSLRSRWIASACTFPVSLTTVPPSPKLVSSVPSAL
jgi:hypothetical protein